MPHAIVLVRHNEHNGLLTHSKNSRLNHFISARITQSWYFQAGLMLGPMLAASAAKRSASSCAAS